MTKPVNLGESLMQLLRPVVFSDIQLENLTKTLLGVLRHGKIQILNVFFSKLKVRRKNFFNNTCKEVYYYLLHPTLSAKYQSNFST